MAKIERLMVFAKFVRELAFLSKCTERHVAAIITDSDLTQVHSIGINGGAKSLADCMCVLEGKYGCVHAEINALVKNQCHDKDKVMITSLSPCKQCAAAIINAPGGFVAVYYLEEWKDQSGVKMLNNAGIITSLITI